MVIERLKITDYRNYASAEIFPGRGVNLFMGDNAQGKTNLLESIRLASVGRSARTTRWQELIRWGTKAATVNVRVRSAAGADEVTVRLADSKQVLVNGFPIARMGELMGVVKTVLFTPDELRIVKEGPGERRRFADIALCQLSRGYFYALTRYNRILAQRNKLLKGDPTDAELTVWDMQLAREGARVTRTRRKFVERLAVLAEEVHKDISGGEKLEVGYEGAPGDELGEIEAGLLASLEKSRSRDRQFAVTHVGPQRDDLSIKADGIDLRSFGSQGQQRSAALSLKLAEMELLGREGGEYPVLLLDDVLSELDERRQSKLIEKIRSYQTVITCTHLTADVREKIGEVTEFAVRGGTVEMQGARK